MVCYAALGPNTMNYKGFLTKVKKQYKIPLNINLYTVNLSMAEIIPEVNIKNIRQMAKIANQKKTVENNQETNRLLKKVLDLISLNAIIGSSGRISMGLHDIYHRELYPHADKQKVLDILKDRGFEVSINRAHPAFPDCDCNRESCMDWLRVENTWSSFDEEKN